MKRAIGWVVPLGLVVVWELAARVGGLPANFLSAPSNVLSAAWRLTASGELPNHIGVSAH